MDFYLKLLQKFNFFFGGENQLAFEILSLLPVLLLSL